MEDQEEYNPDYHGEDELEPDLEVEGDLGSNLNENAIADASAELDAMKKRLQEMETEASKLRELQSKVERDAGLGPAGSLENPNKEEADARSVYVGQVDYGCAPEELQMHFQDCGTVNRVTILSDKFGTPKGFAYIEFLEADAVQNALLLDGSELRGRQIKVLPKRTNVPGFKNRGRGRGRGFRGGRGGYYGGRGYYGYAPRGRGRGRFYSPY